MKPQYEVYTRGNDGKRGTIVKGIITLDTTLRANEPIKWKMKGAGLEPCPLAEGSEIAVFRNLKTFYCGFVNKRQLSYDAATKIYDWEVSGLSDLGKLSRRLIYPNPAVETIDPDGTYTAEGVLNQILLTLIRQNAGQSAVADRMMPKLFVSTQEDCGVSQAIESRYDDVLKFVQDKLKDTDITIREVWDMETGGWDILISNPVDVSSNVVFSVENGSISSWEQTMSEPKGNYLIVTGCKKPKDPNNSESGDETMYVIVTDSDSIKKWGRVEAVVHRSDITRNEDENETWSSVMDRLVKAAYEELEKATAKFGYKLTTADINRNIFQEDYNIGDIVSVRIGDDEFKSKIKEIKVTYSGGVETIVPSVGTMQKGELESVFTELGTTKDQVQVLQKTEIIEKRQVQEVRTALTTWVEESEDDDDEPVPEDITVVAQKVTQVKSMINRLKSNIRDMLY